MTKARSLSRRTVLAAAGGLGAPWLIRSGRAAGVIRIGHMTDVSGPYSANSGAAPEEQSCRPLAEGGCPFVKV
jgi:hypothetical protein